MGEQLNGLEVVLETWQSRLEVAQESHRSAYVVFEFHLAGRLPSVSHREVVHEMSLAPDGCVFGVSFHLPNMVCWVAGCGTLPRSTSRCHTTKPIEPIKSEIWPKGSNAVGYQDFDFWLLGVNIELIRAS